MEWNREGVGSGREGGAGYGGGGIGRRSGM